jgi:hypothetical protein
MRFGSNFFQILSTSAIRGSVAIAAWLGVTLHTNSEKTTTTPKNHSPNFFSKGISFLMRIKISPKKWLKNKKTVDFYGLLL